MHIIIRLYIPARDNIDWETSLISKKKKKKNRNIKQRSYSIISLCAIIIKGNEYQLWRKFKLSKQSDGFKSKT